MVGPHGAPMTPWTRTPCCRLPAAPAGRVLRPTYDASVFPGVDRDALLRMTSGYGGLLHWKTSSYELPSIVATIRAAYPAFSQREAWICAISATTIITLTTVLQPSRPLLPPTYCRPHLVRSPRGLLQLSRPYPVADQLTRYRRRASPPSLSDLRSRGQRDHSLATRTVGGSREPLWLTRCCRPSSTFTSMGPPPPKPRLTLRGGYHYARVWERRPPLRAPRRNRVSISAAGGVRFHRRRRHRRGGPLSLPFIQSGAAARCYSAAGAHLDADSRVVCPHDEALLAPTGQRCATSHFRRRIGHNGPAGRRFIHRPPEDVHTVPEFPSSGRSRTEKDGRLPPVPAGPIGSQPLAGGASLL